MSACWALEKQRRRAGARGVHTAPLRERLSIAGAPWLRGLESARPSYGVASRVWRGRRCGLACARSGATAHAARLIIDDCGHAARQRNATRPKQELEDRTDDADQDRRGRGWGGRRSLQSFTRRAIGSGILRALGSKQLLGWALGGGSVLCRPPGRVSSVERHGDRSASGTTGTCRSSSAAAGLRRSSRSADEQAVDGAAYDWRRGQRQRLCSRRV